MTKDQIRGTVEKQLQLLSDRSRETIDLCDLLRLADAMLSCPDWLLDNETETTSTIVRVPAEKAALAAAIRGILAEAAEGHSLRQWPSLETNLVNSFGDSKLKEIGQQISGILLEHGLTKSPDTCTELFRYRKSVVRGRNEV